MGGGSSNASSAFLDAWVRRVSVGEIGAVTSLCLVAGCAPATAPTATVSHTQMSAIGPYVPPSTVPTDVTIRCLVKTDGRTDDCTIVSYKGSLGFAESAHRR